MTRRNNIYGSLDRSRGLDQSCGASIRAASTASCSAQPAVLFVGRVAHTHTYTRAHTHTHMHTHTHTHAHTHAHTPAHAHTHVDGRHGTRRRQQGSQPSRAGGDEGGARGPPPPPLRRGQDLQGLGTGSGLASSVSVYGVSGEHWVSRSLQAPLGALGTAAYTLSGCQTGW